MHRICFLAATFLMIGSQAQAGGVDNVNEFSAQRIRTCTRAASTDSDSAAYNPAGLVHLDDGLYVALSNLSVFDNYEHAIGDDVAFGGFGSVLDGTSYNPMVPSLMAIYKKGNMAGYFNFHVPGGGGSVNYADGSITTYSYANRVVQDVATTMGAAPDLLADHYAGELNHDVMATSMYLGFTLGAAFAIDDKVSFSFGTRFVTAKNTLNASFSFLAAGPNLDGLDLMVDAGIENKSEAAGFGAIVGLDVKPFDGLNFGMRFETPTRLEFRNKDLDVHATAESAMMDTIAPGATDAIAAGIVEMASSTPSTRRDLPGVFAFGAAYHVIPKLEVQWNLGFYLNRLASWGGDEAGYENDWETSLSFEYSVLPELQVSVGGIYTDLGHDANHNSPPESPEFDSYSFGGGVQYKIIDSLKVNAGYVKTFRGDMTTREGYVVRKTSNIFAIGLELHTL